jgi:uncharacterized protein YndB with AHSA1/START domain
MTLDGAYSKLDDGSHEVRFVRTFPQPIAKVWAALTDPAVLAKWIGAVEIEPRAGGKFVLRFAGSSAVMTGEITRFEPPRLLEYTWTEPNYTPALVRWELAEAAGATRLALTHTAPPEAGRSDVLGYLGGWHDYLDDLPSVLAGGERADAKGRWAKLDEGYRVKFTGAAAPDEKAIFSKVGHVRLERLLPGPIERVWAHLTDATLIPAWYGEDGAIEPRVGGAVRLMGGHIRGVVTQWRPPHRLSYTWSVFDPADPPGAASAYPESYLTFTLARHGARVLLALEHTPIPARFEKQTAMGWHTMLDLVAAALGGDHPERPPLMQKNAALYGVDMQNLAR